MNYTDIAKKYINNGYKILPVGYDKLPYKVGETWIGGKDVSFFKDCWGIAIITSDGIECLDIDNHFGDGKDNFIKFMSYPEIKEIYEKYKIPIQKTQGGGYHFVYRCEEIRSNKKLAWRFNNKLNRAEALFEIKAGNGYFICNPTPNYSVVKNDIFKIPLITPEEREIIWEVAISFNEYEKPTRITQFETSNGGYRVGDQYNDNPESINEMKSLIEGLGWIEVGDKKWRRPDKNKGIGATLGQVAPNIFYVFTSSASPFESMKAYTPFQVLALVKFNGDFREAAKSLRPETKTKVQKNEPTSDEIKTLLITSEMDLSKPVDKPPTILSIVEDVNGEYVSKRLFTLGNFSVLIGRAKSKKTFLQILLTSSILKDSKQEKFISHLPPNKPLVMYFDTEQGEYDSHNVMKKIIHLGGNSQNFKGFNLRPFSPKERLAIIELALETYGERTCFAVIDGIADLVTAINDEEESTKVTTFLLSQTKKYNLHISTVIHQNKNDNFATGHIGSAVMKKAEILISVVKNKDNKAISDINCDLSRGIGFEPFSIMINDKGLPEHCEYIAPTKIKEDNYFDNRSEQKQTFIDFYNNEKDDDEAPF